MNWEDIPLNTSIGKEPYDGRKNCARGTLPLNSTTATGTPSCVPPGLKSLVALQFSSNYVLVPKLKESQMFMRLRKRAKSPQFR
jgi:hypothetical protein